MQFTTVKALSFLASCLCAAPLMANLSISIADAHAVIESDQLPVRPPEVEKAKPQTQPKMEEFPKNDENPLDRPSNFEPPQQMLAQNYFDPGTHADDIKPIDPQPVQQMPTQQVMPQQAMPQQNQWFDPGMNAGPNQQSQFYPQGVPPQGQYQDPAVFEELQRQRAERYQKAMEKLQEFAADGFSSNHQSGKYTSRPGPKFGYYEKNRQRRQQNDLGDPQMMTDDERKQYMYEKMRSIYPGRSQ